MLTWDEIINSFSNRGNWKDTTKNNKILDFVNNDLKHQIKSWNLYAIKVILIVLRYDLREF
jgi:hypothetical protein